MQPLTKLEISYILPTKSCMVQPSVGGGASTRIQTKEAVLLGKVSMILKIASLSATRLASLMAHLASVNNIIEDVFDIDRNIVESSGPPAYVVKLMTSKSVDRDKHDVTLEVAETFVLNKDKESQLRHPVPSKYLLEVVQTVGLFPAS